MAKLIYACILTGNLERLAAFYRTVLQSDPQWSGRYVEFVTGPATFSLWDIEAYREIAGPGGLASPGAGGTMLEFEVADADAEFARLQQLAEFSIDFIIPPTTMAWGNRSIYFRDPDGNLVNLFTHVG